MKYYIIEEIVDYYGSTISKPLFIAEHEEIAKDIIKRYDGLTYVECDTEESKDEQRN